MKTSEERSIPAILGKNATFGTVPAFTWTEERHTAWKPPSLPAALALAE
jgi:hypothetical protein